MVVALFEPRYAVDVVALQIRVIAYAALVTGLSPAATEFQVINPSDVFHEFSDEMRQAAEKDGKMPQRWSGCSLDEPSARMFMVSMYLLS